MTRPGIVLSSLGLPCRPTLREAGRVVARGARTAGWVPINGSESCHHASFPTSLATRGHADRAAGLNNISVSGVLFHAGSAQPTGLAGSSCAMPSAMRPSMRAAASRQTIPGSRPGDPSRSSRTGARFAKSSRASRNASRSLALLWPKNPFVRNSRFLGGGATVVSFLVLPGEFPARRLLLVEPHGLNRRLPR